MTITYDDITDTKKGQIMDLLSKRESIESLLADLQTERAAAEVGRVQKEQQLMAEMNRITEELRKLRKATLS